MTKLSDDNQVLDNQVVVVVYLELVPVVSLHHVPVQPALAHEGGLAVATPPQQLPARGRDRGHLRHGSKQRRECRAADTLSTELSQHNIYSFFSGLSNSKVVGLLVKLKPE